MCSKETTNTEKPVKQLGLRNLEKSLYIFMKENINTCKAVLQVHLVSNTWQQKQTLRLIAYDGHRKTCLYSRTRLIRIRLIRIFA